MNPQGWMLSPRQTLHPVYILNSSAHHDFRPQNRLPYPSRYPTPLPAPSPYATYPPAPQIYENSMSGMSHQNGVPSQLVSPISGYQHSYSTPDSRYQIPHSTTWVDTTPQYIVQPPLAHVSIGSAGTMADSCGIAELKETIEKVNSELNQLRTKISELNAKVREQEKCLSTAQTEMSNLREENAQAQTEMSNLREVNAQAQTEMSNLREENAQAQTEISNLREENTQAQTEMSNLREENAQAQTEISNLREEKAQAQTEISNLREENFQAQTEISNLREENAQLASSLKEVQGRAGDRIQKLEQQLTEKETELIRVQDCQDRAGDRIQKLEQQLTEKETELIRVQDCQGRAGDRIQKLEQQLTEKETELIRVKDCQDRAGDRIQKLEQQLTEKETELIRVKDCQDRAGDRIQKLEQQLTEKETELIRVQDCQGRAGDRIQKLEQQLTEKETELIRVQDCQGRAGDRIQKLEQQLTEKETELNRSEEKCWVVQERLALAEKKLAQFSEKPVTAAGECLAQISFPLVEKDGNSAVVKYDSNIKHLLKRKKPDEETKENNVKTIKLTSILKGDSNTEKKLKFSKKREKSCPSNTHLICNKEVVIQLERLNDSTVEVMTACGSALPPQQTKKKLKLSQKKEKSYPSNPHLICNKEDVIPFERLNVSTVKEMTACGSALPPEQTKKKLKLSKKKEKSYSSNPHLICNKEDMIPFERLNDSTVTEMTACGSALPPEQTKKKLKLSKKKEKSYSSNPHLICNKEDMIPFERLNDSTVTEMTACGSALPPEQTKKKLKLSKKKEKSYSSNPHLICNKEDMIPFERLNDSTVTEMTACGSALPPEQTKKKLKLSKKKEKSYSSNPHLICNKEDMIPFERLNDSTVTEMTACGSALPPEQEDTSSISKRFWPPIKTKKKLKLSKKKEKSYSSNPHLICNKEDMIPFERLNDSTVTEMTACGSALPPEQVNESNDDALGINSLPDDIIEEIFGYFTQNQLGQLARVCRRWNVLAKSPDFWRKVNVKIFLYFKEKNTVIKSFINGLPSCVTFLRLDFPGYDYLDFEELCMGLHQNCPHVEELIMINLKMSYLLTEVINFCTQLLPCVKKLVFHNCRFYDCSRRVELNDNSKIEVLDLFRCSITHFNKKQFSKLLYLKELRLADTTVNDTWFEDDTSFFNHLHVLDVASTYITLTTILAIQRHGHNLKELYLCRCNLGYRDLNFNNSMLPHLKTICLRGCYVKCEGVVSLIQSCPSLENVYVKQHLVRSFAAHPFVIANRCKSEIVKAIDFNHNHKVDYSHT